MIRTFTLVILASVLTACANKPEPLPEPPKPKVIVKVERKVITKTVKRDCPPIPDRSHIVNREQDDAWILQMIKQYKECAK